MKHSKIGSVMTSEVVSAQYGTPFKEVAKRLAEYRISGLPVIDADDKVVGVISETDLLVREAQAPDPYQAPRRFRLPRVGKGGRKDRAKATARTAGQLMSTPPVCVHADNSIAEGARCMAQHKVERLPVVDEEDRLVGIVTRRDLLQVFLRADDEIRHEVIEQVLVRTLWLAPQTIKIDVQDGVVTLEGQLERRSEVPVALHMTREIDGVVAVVDKLTHRVDDSHLQPNDQAMRGVTDDWLRKL
ncbi:CBS domain-containing protein [Streptomyces sp. NBC_01381]|uniref:CBS domain-containing protein n=1 Tax=Streptomyces sp. NBC_01381 TaxID=2903845 RepID=UPI002253A7F0|nr:CBS domain-containing protein [Streptomyces sp. NBC_01381]MCX4673715.1 CBS domain-containing protein [Streptomyces sp. NBC_01381]